MSIWILETLLGGKSQLNHTFQIQTSLSDRIVCFLSVLELARLNHIDFTQKNHLSPIVLDPRYSQHIPKIALYELENIEDSA